MDPADTAGCRLATQNNHLGVFSGGRAIVLSERVDSLPGEGDLNGDERIVARARPSTAGGWRCGHRPRRRLAFESSPRL